MVREMEMRHQDNNESIRSIAKEFQVDPVQLRRWRRQLAVFDNFLNSTNAPVNKRAVSIHRGRQSCLHPIEEDLLEYIFSLRDQGLAVSVRMVLIKASQVCAEFRRKNERAKDQAVRRFVASHGLVHRVHTHQSQEDIAAVYQKATDWMKNIRPILQGPNRDERYIINMDQTPIFFSMLPSTTLERSGSRTVNVRTSNDSTMRVTVAVTVTANGEMLTPLFVFKGKPGGRIEREFGTYPANGTYSVQEKAWMDERVMLLWVKQVLGPYIETAPPGIQPILLLDSYRCHMMESVRRVIEELGVRLEHIAGGCTGLCQPIDVGIGKPLKSRVRHKWEDWMVEQHAILAQQKFIPPSRYTVADWVTRVLHKMPRDIIMRSWRHEPYSYFPDAVGGNLELDAVGGNLELVQYDLNGVAI